MNKKLLGVLCTLAVLSSCFIYAQEGGNGGNNNNNIQAPMNMNIEGEGQMGSNFRGSDGSSNNFLEDCPYRATESSVIYSPSGSPAGSGGNREYSGAPQNTWTVTDDNDPDYRVSSASNSLTNNSQFKNPGQYTISNSGVRQVSNAGGASSANGMATANGAIGVTIHDVTAPDVCVAFEECIGNDFVSNQEELSNKIVQQMVANAGEPFESEETAKDLDGTSYIFVDEGSSGERNKLPEQKTVRYTLCGNLFNANGTPTFKNERINTQALDSAAKTQQAVVEGGANNSVFKGVFVRRNVPFITLVRSIDNGDKRKSIGSTEQDGIKFTIYKGSLNGEEVQPGANGEYLFRIPNYPREDYQDQPDYFFEATAKDVSQNLTKITGPVYIVNNTASFEGSTNR